MHRYNCTCNVCTDEQDYNPYATEDTNPTEDFDIWDGR